MHGECPRGTFVGDMAKTTLSAKRNLQRWRSHEAGEELETGRREPIYLALVCKNQNDYKGHRVTSLLVNKEKKRASI